MMSVCRKRAESRSIHGQGNDQRKQASVCLEIRANVGQKYRKFSSTRIMYDSFGHVESLEMGILKIATRELLDDIGVFLNDWRNGRAHDVDVFVCVWGAGKDEVDVNIVATRDEHARLA